MAECHFPFSGHRDLDLVFRIFVSRAYILYYFRYESQIWFVHASWDDKVSRNIHGSLTLTSELVSRIGIESDPYLLYSLR